ncbi:hypothetical protein A3A36_01140 [Candidatus Kaiserbacteria bacterium RIFCSPLOWO2_01_FULL_52_12b]|uniref:Uncharacterized protein n=1 Tax=Candidatus Kaiserbacteria bacterium RIFCSPLOWO2_01_FULL_52_12b TaxID=1798509 RepID=A0A1F6EX44_9BACT|nr:MAG: hypothetical protein A3A36_01140 [Candidatus Kaiserbacteria bacterium RIFCSPLOWO2_01_FULL_52_12b]
MPAYTGDDALLHLTKLYTAAYDLIEKNGRKWCETDALFEAMQRYKDKTLGWAEPKFSPVDHRIMFGEAMRGSRAEYERLLDSFREFGVNQRHILRLKSKSKTLLELWRISLPELHRLVDHYPWEHIVATAFLEIQKKIGIEKPVRFPALDSSQKKELQKLADAFNGPPRT